METQQTVQCPLPGLETVKITYNLMATFEQLRQLRQRLTAEAGKAVIVRAEGLQADLFGDQTPLALQYWAAYTGWDEAVNQMLFGPKSPTA